MTDKNTGGPALKPEEIESGIKAIRELMDGVSPGRWDWSRHNREDGKPPESVEDVVSILALSARKSPIAELHGVCGQEDGEDIVVCYTGNGPRRAENARFLANAKDAILWLIRVVEESRRPASETERAREDVIRAVKAWASVRPRNKGDEWDGQIFDALARLSAAEGRGECAVPPKD